MLSRRRFLGATAGALALFASPLEARRRGRGLLIGSRRIMRDRKIEFALVVVDEQGHIPTTIPLGFHFHGFAPHPRAARAALFEKKGPGACEVDLDGARVVRTIATAPERHFYGHGAFSPDGRYLYATETVLSTGEGLLVVRDAATMQPIGQARSFGTRPHDCLLGDDGKTMVVTNGGGPLGGDAPSVTVVDLAADKLVDRVTLDEPRLNTGHVARTSAGELVIVSAPRDGLPKTERGGVSFRRAGAPARTMREPADVVARMIGETLSVAVDEPTRITGVTNPDGNLLTFWDYARGALVRAVPLDRPRGIARTLDGAHFVVSCGEGAGLVFFSTRTLAPAPALDVADAAVTGSHLFTWERPA